MSYETRLQRLEAQRRQPWPVSHFVPVVCYPWPVGEPDDHDWRRALVCPCGQRGCPELRIGIMLPEKAPSADAERAEGNGRDG
jgi:hypothetical protein